MTIAPASDRVTSPTSAAAGQTVFDGDFPLLDAAALEVWRLRAGAWAKLTLTSDYTVVLVGANSYPRVTLLVGSLLDDQITLVGRNSAIARTSSYADGGGIRDDEFNDDFVRVTLALQELRRDVDAAVRTPAHKPGAALDAGGRGLSDLAHLDLVPSVALSPSPGVARLYVRDNPLTTPTLALRTSNGAEVVFGAGGGGGGVDITAALALKADAVLTAAALAGKAAIATTLAGYGITNAYTKPQVDTLLAGGGGGGALTVIIQRFAANGTYTPTVGMAYCIVEAVGGGGGGGGSTASATFLTAGGCGGGAEYARSVFSAAAIGASKAVVIGVGGLAAAAGGHTTFGATLLIARGGSAGVGGSSGAFGSPGAGGTGGTGQILVPGMVGSWAPYNSGAGGFVPSGSSGGHSLLGSSARPVTAPSGSFATGLAAAANSGGGGSGGMSNFSGTSTAGGVGGSGVLIVTEFIMV